MSKSTTTGVMSLSLALLLGSQAVFADKPDQAVSEAKISLIDAITAAEQHQGGVAFEAELEDNSIAPEYEVKVLQNGREYEVTIDGVNGSVKNVREDS